MKLLFNQSYEFIVVLATLDDQSDLQFFKKNITLCYYKMKTLKLKLIIFLKNYLINIILKIWKTKNYDSLNF